MSQDSTSKCKSAEKMIAAEQKLRAKALSQPTYRDGEPFIVAAIEFSRVLRRHWNECSACQRTVAA